MSSNHKTSNFVIILIVSWAITIILGLYTYNTFEKNLRMKMILREYFDREVAKSKVLQLFEPNIHNRVLNNLFEEWLKNKNSNVLTSTIK
jgi:peptidoglycan/LPS O-acetylase OafA/YrhL